MARSANGIEDDVSNGHDERGKVSRIGIVADFRRPHRDNVLARVGDSSIRNRERLPNAVAQRVEIDARPHPSREEREPGGKDEKKRRSPDRHTHAGGPSRPATITKSWGESDRLPLSFSHVPGAPRRSLRRPERAGQRRQWAHLRGRGSPSSVWAGRDQDCRPVPRASSLDEGMIRRLEREGSRRGRDQPPQRLRGHGRREARRRAALILVMELLPARRSATSPSQGDALPMARSRWICVPDARRARAAHARGIIHRDIKPENIFLTSSAPGSTRQGARLRRSPRSRASPSRTATSSPRRHRHGHDGYMSPEQLKGP